MDTININIEDTLQPIYINVEDRIVPTLDSLSAAGLYTNNIFWGSNTFNGTVSIEGNTTWTNLTSNYYSAASQSFESYVYPWISISDIVGRLDTVEISNELDVDNLAATNTKLFDDNTVWNTEEGALQGSLSGIALDAYYNALNSLVVSQANTNAIIELSASGGGGGGPSTDTLNDVAVRGNTTPLGISVGSLSANSILLSPLSTSPTFKEGTLYYDQGTHTLAYMNDNPDVRVNIGEESLIRCRNASGVLIPNGQAVRISGAQGNRPKITKATADAHPFGIHDNEIIGVATHDISDNEDGYVTVLGVVRNLDLSLFAEGDPLYLQIDGSLNTTPPPLPYDKILVGYVTVANNNGQMFVSPIQPVHLNDISGVSVPTIPNNGDVLAYSSTLSAFGAVNIPLTDYLPLSGGTLTGDVEFSDLGDGIILKSPNNTRWRITIKDTGALIVTTL